jgi:RNA polymerase sigma-70 factor (ECF subfamily)
MSKFPDTRETLLVRIANPEDHAAWMEFVETYESVVLRYCIGHGLQLSDAREVVQEVWMVVHRKIADWRSSGQVGSFRSWLLKTAHLQCLRSLRVLGKADRACGGTSVLQRLHDVAAPAGVGSEAEERQEWERWVFRWAAETVRSEVQPATWNAFWLSAVEGWAAERVADELKMRVGTVYTSKCRVMARIRHRAAELSSGDNQP